MRKTIVFLLIMCMVVSFGFAGGNKDVQAGTSISGTLQTLYPGISDYEKEMAYVMEAEVKTKYPDIKIDWMMLGWEDIATNITTMVQAGAVPDLVTQQAVTDAVAMNALEPLDSWVANDSELSLDTFSKTAMAYQSEGGKLYALPILDIVHCNVVDGTALDLTGARMTDIKTWDDILVVAKNYRDKTGKYFFGNSFGLASHAWECFVRVAGSNGLDFHDTSAASKKKYIEVLDFLVKTKPYTNPASIQWDLQGMLRGLENQDCAWVMAGSWVDANIIAYGERAMKTMHPVAFPRGPSAKPDEYGVYTGALGISMFRNSKNKPAAWNTIKVFVSPKVSGTYAGGLHVPARSDVPDQYIIDASKTAFPNTYNDHLRIIKEFQELKQYGRARPEPMGFNAMFIVIQEAMVEIFTSSNPNTEAIYSKIKTGIDNIAAQYK